MVAIVKPTLDETTDVIGGALLATLDERLPDCCLDIAWMPRQRHFSLRIHIREYNQLVITAIPLRQFIHAMSAGQCIQWRHELTEVTKRAANNVADWVRRIENRLKSVS